MCSCYCSVLGIFKITVTPRYKCYVGIREGVNKAHVSSLASKSHRNWKTGLEPRKIMID